jgi:hypothetical protein
VAEKEFDLLKVAAILAASFAEDSTTLQVAQPPNSSLRSSASRVIAIPFKF